MLISPDFVLVRDEQMSRFFECCPCVRISRYVMKRENQLEATQWFIELMIRSASFGHYYAHHREPETVQMITACGT